MINLKKFETNAAYNSYIGGGEAILPNVSLVTENQGVHYNPLVDWSKEYLTFEISGSGNINWKTNKDSSIKTIEYSKNDGEWTSITSTTGGTQINVAAGDVVKFRGDGNISSGGSAYNCFSGTTCQFIVKGNIMSLIDSTGFATATTLTGAYNFLQLFINCTGLTDASNLVLPATTLANNCYVSMFGGCTSLTTAPVLPATTLVRNCYYNMFYNCTSLTTAPVLPATTLANNCYSSMFGGCTSLTTAPVLPATTLAQGCYYNMFNGCTALNYIKCLATDISAYQCTYYWVSGVAATGTFVKNASMSSWTTGVDGIPSNWTVQDA